MLEPKYRKYCDYSIEEGPNEDNTEWCITFKSSYPVPEIPELGRCSGCYDMDDGTSMAFYSLVED